MEPIITQSYELPFALQSGTTLIKHTELSRALSIEEEINAFKERALNEAQKNTQQLTEKIKAEQNRILLAMDNTIDELKNEHASTLSDLQSTLQTVVARIIETFQMSLSSEEKLLLAAKNVISEYGFKDNLELVVESASRLDSLGLDIPKTWKIKEDPTLKDGCRIKLNSGIAECAIDTVFENLSSQLLNNDE